MNYPGFMCDEGYVAMNEFSTANGLMLNLSSRVYFYLLRASLYSVETCNGIFLSVILIYSGVPVKSNVYQKLLD